MIEIGAGSASRIVLGTVALGLPYGRHAGYPVPSVDRVSGIFAAAWNAGIRAFDTAQAYGSAPERLSSWLRATKRLGDAHIVTKVSTERARDLPGAVRDAVMPFRGAATVTVFAHDKVSRAGLELTGTNALGPIGVVTRD